MGRNASHGEPRRMHGPDTAGPSPFEGRQEAATSSDNGYAVARG